MRKRLKNSSMINIKKIHSIVASLVAMVAVFGVQSCATDTVADLREKDYGYVQFKLYKSASYTPSTDNSRAVQVEELDYLADACKIEVNLYDENNRAIRQSLVLSASNNESAEFGLRSDKLKLLAGNYKLGMITLFNTLDEVLYRKVPESALDFTVVEGGLTSHDVTVDVTARGFVKLSLVKDMSNLQPSTRGSREREYTFDEIKYVDVSLKRVREGETIGTTIVLENLPAKFSQHFDEENYQSDKEGWKTSSILCDTLISLEADTYRVVSYVTKSKKGEGNTLEINDKPALSEFSVSDNAVTEAKVKVALYESDEYIKDNYASHRELLLAKSNPSR